MLELCVYEAAISCPFDRGNIGFGINLTFEDSTVIKFNTKRILRSNTYPRVIFKAKGVTIINSLYRSAQKSNLQLTKILISASKVCSCFRALFQTSHLQNLQSKKVLSFCHNLMHYLNDDPSSLFVGFRFNTETVASSLFSPRIMEASSCCEAPTLNHLIWGGGEPPKDTQVRLIGRPSVAIGTEVSIFGVLGGSRTVKLKVCL